jgi:RNA polymerase sigma-70 factor (ECF subfamily)
MSDTSISLLDRLRLRPDEAAWKRLVDIYTPLLHTWLRRYAVQPEDADDLVQEVLVVVARELPQFHHDQRRGAFRCWLRTILIHRLRDAWRARRYRPIATGDSAVEKHLEELADPDSGLSRLWDEEHDRHVLRCLVELIEPAFASTTWKAFQRVALDGARPADVAAELGISVNAVWLAKSRVLQRLRQEAQGLID